MLAFFSEFNLNMNLKIVMSHSNPSPLKIFGAEMYRFVAAACAIGGRIRSYSIYTDS